MPGGSNVSWHIFDSGSDSEYEVDEYQSSLGDEAEGSGERLRSERTTTTTETSEYSSPPPAIEAPTPMPSSPRRPSPTPPRPPRFGGNPFEIALPRRTGFGAGGAMQHTHGLGTVADHNMRTNREQRATFRADTDSDASDESTDDEAARRPHIRPRLSHISLPPRGLGRPGRDFPDSTPATRPTSPPAATATANVRAGPTRDRSIVDLTADSDDDVVFEGARAGAGSSNEGIGGEPRRRAPQTARRARPYIPGGGPSRQEVQDAIRDADAALARTRSGQFRLLRQERDAQRHNRDEAERDRARRLYDREASRDDPLPPPRIRLGGAVYRPGNQAPRVMERTHAEQARAMQDLQRGPPRDVDQVEHLLRQAEQANRRYAPPPGRAAQIEAGERRAWMDWGHNMRFDNVWDGLGRHALAAAMNGAGFLRNGLGMFGDIGGIGGVGGGGGVGGAGAGAGLPDVPAIIQSIKPNPYPDALDGMTNDFDLETSQPISVDDDGNVIKPRPPKLCCVSCLKPFRLSANQQSEDERVFALRCGHLFHNGCVKALSTPTKEELDKTSPPDLPVLGGEADDYGAPQTRKRKRRQAPKTKAPPKPPARRWTWTCPVKGCGREHVSYEKEEGEWVQRAGKGAIQVYM